MVDGRQEETWNHTASLMALVANCNRDPKKRSQPYTTADFNPRPAAGRNKREVLHLPDDETFAILKSVFVDQPRKDQS